MMIYKVDSGRDYQLCDGIIAIGTYCKSRLFRLADNELMIHTHLIRVFNWKQFRAQISSWEHFESISGLLCHCRSNFLGKVSKIWISYYILSIFLKFSPSNKALKNCLFYPRISQLCNWIETWKVKECRKCKDLVKMWSVFQNYNEN